MKVEIDKSIKTFRFPSSELIYFGHATKISKLFDEDIMIYCTYDDTIYIPYSIQLTKNYGHFKKDIMEVHMSVVDMYIILISKLFDEGKLLIMDGETGKFIKYTKNESLIKPKPIEKPIRFTFLDLFSYK